MQGHALAVKRAASPQCREQVVQVGHQDVAQAEGCLPLRQIKADCVLRNRHRPEDAAVRDPGIVIVKLEIVVTELVTGLEDVHSKESEGALMLLSVDANIGPLHEAHVGSERQVEALAGQFAGLRIKLAANAGAVNIQDRHLSLKVEDGRRLRSRAGQEKMEEAIGESRPEGLLRVES